MLYGSESWPVKEKDVFKVERNDTRIIGWMSNASPEERISAGELRPRLKLKSIRQCLQDRRLEWFGCLEIMGENSWSIKHRTYKDSAEMINPWKFQPLTYGSKVIEIENLTEMGLLG